MRDSRAAWIAGGVLVTLTITGAVLQAMAGEISWLKAAFFIVGVPLALWFLWSGLRPRTIEEDKQHG